MHNKMGVKDWYENMLEKVRLPEWPNLSRFIEDKDFNSQGFTTKVMWNATYDDAVKSAKERNKPIMLIVHADECRSCRSFRDWFSRSSGIIQLSQQFAVVAVSPEKLPPISEITRDGKYVPQVIFLTPGGKVIRQGERHLAETGQKHFFPGTTPLLDAMRTVLNSFQPKSK